MRSVERLEGLAALGSATLGPIPLAVPAVLDTSTAPPEPLGPTIASLPAPAGERRTAFRAGTTTWELPTPVLAPEIAPSPGGVFPTSIAAAVLVHAPAPEPALRALRDQWPELIVLGNARALWNEGAPFVEAIRALREAVGPEPLLWAPRVALPHRLPLLAYLGVDVTDTTEGLLEAADGVFFDLALGARKPVGTEPPSPCGCTGCASGGPSRLVEHARQLYARSLSETRDALRRGFLRELAEARQIAEPANAEHLRYADRDLYPLLEERTPVTGAGRHTYVLTESHRRPEMQRFRARFLERYRPPPSKSILLLVPCSRTKPYRVSPSHRRIAHALEGLPGVERVHLVSVSSPLGLVPRELEDVPPARHYDVPVTGDWSATEREYVTRGLGSILRHGRYRAAVLHLDPQEYAFLREAVPATLPAVSTLSDHRTTSGAALDRLRNELARLLAEAPFVPGGFRTVALEEFAALAAVQLGEEAARRLIVPPARLVGRPWFLRFTDGRQDLATVREERGLLHLTTAGAERLGDALLRVDADPAITLQGDLFVPGVRGADDRIRAGDSVGVYQDGRFTGVGEAALAGRLMLGFGRGVAVKVRHRRHPSADTDKTERLAPPEQGR